MISDAPSFDRLAAFDADVCVVGGGPVGVVAALELSGRGARVLLLESGGTAPSRAAQSLSAHENLRPETHHDPEIVVARRLGGASNLWGGRCLPFDPVDFAPRPWPELPAWPIGPADLAPFEEAACRYLAAGRPVWREPLPGVAADPAFGWESLERWSNVPRVQVLHREALARRETLLAALGATVTGFDYDGSGRIAALDLHLEGPGRGGLAAREVVLCAGGNESARLLLAERRRRSDLFGGPDGPLGRFYMGHVNGRIADIVFEDAALHDGLNFHVDAHGSYVRRRLVPSPETQAEARLLNVAFWPVVPEAKDPAHRSGPLSAAYLVLSVGPLGRRLVAESIRRQVVGEGPARRGAHLRNLLLDPLRTLTAIPDYLWRSRAARMRLPGFFLTNPARRYGLEYHSEQLPTPDSRLTLAEATDRLGLPLLRVDLRFSEEDAASVVRAHDALEDWLRRNRLARLEHRVARDARAAAVLALARHGAHQVGTVRMGTDPRGAVVDGHCRAFDVPNLHVVSTAVLPTSGQANPTFTAVQLGLRLARRLAPGG
jgi:choline dehydrogenase-like flavoprotein